MDCTSEEQLVRLRLREVDGVEDLRFDLDARQLEVVHRLTAEDVLALLAPLGLGEQHLGDREPVTSDHVIDGASPGHQRRALVIALGLNAGLFVVEVGAGLVSGSTGLVADGLDMGADALVYALALAAVGLAPAAQRRLTSASGWLQLALAVGGLALVVVRVAAGAPPPDPATMVGVSVLALAANVATLLVLRGVRGDGSHLRASWIFTTNDVIVNLLVIGAAGLVAVTDLAVPDLAVGTVVFLVVANGARRILSLSRSAA